MGHGLSRRGQGKTKRLATFQVQAEKALRHFERLLVGIESLNRCRRIWRLVEFCHAMRINSQQSALEVAAGASDFTQCHLQRLGLGDRMALEQFMNGIIGRHKRQSIRELKTLLS